MKKSWLHKYQNLDQAKEDAVTYNQVLEQCDKTLDSHLNKITEDYSFLQVEIRFWAPFIAVNLPIIQYFSEGKPIGEGMIYIGIYFFAS